MSTKIIEGVEYILKSSVENIIKDRVSKVAARANQAEAKVNDLQSKLSDMSKSVSNVDILTSRIEELQSELGKSEQKYTRFQSISKHGLSDPRMVAAVEYVYDYEQQKLPKKDRQSLSDWLDYQVENPDQSHPLLEPHLRSLKNQSSPAPQQSSPPSQQQQPSPPSQQQQPPSRRYEIPATNKGALPNPEDVNFWHEAATNPKFYEANREEIKERLASNKRQ